MGACASKSEKRKSAKSSLKRIPDYVYFNRRKGKLLKLHNKTVTKLSLASRFFYSTDSAIGYLSNNRLMIAGGSEDGGLRDTVSIIFLETRDTESLPNLPITCKEGQIHEIDEWIYYIGALQNGQNGFIPAPVLRYSQKQGLWQEIKEPERESDKFKFSSLINIGSCLLGKKIFIFGGQRFSKLGNLKSSKLIFSLSFDEGFFVKIEGKLPIKVIRPIVAAGEKHGIMVGGKIPRSGAQNKSCFYMVIKDNQLIVNHIDGLNIQIDEEYPPMYNKDYAMFIAYPNVVIRYRDKPNWVVFKVKDKERKDRGSYREIREECKEKGDFDDGRDEKLMISSGKIVKGEKKAAGIPKRIQKKPEKVEKIERKSENIDKKQEIIKKPKDNKEKRPKSSQEHVQNVLSSNFGVKEAAAYSKPNISDQHHEPFLHQDKAISSPPVVILEKNLVVEDDSYIKSDAKPINSKLHIPALVLPPNETIPMHPQVPVFQADKHKKVKKVKYNKELNQSAGSSSSSSSSSSSDSSKSSKKQPSPTAKSNQNIAFTTTPIKHPINVIKPADSPQDFLENSVKPDLATSESDKVGHHALPGMIFSFSNEPNQESPEAKAKLQNSSPEFPYRSFHDPEDNQKPQIEHDPSRPVHHRQQRVHTLSSEDAKTMLGDNNFLVQAIKSPRRGSAYPKATSDIPGHINESTSHKTSSSQEPGSSSSRRKIILEVIHEDGKKGTKGKFIAKEVRPSSSSSSSRSSSDSDYINNKRKSKASRYKTEVAMNLDGKEDENLKDFLNLSNTSKSSKSKNDEAEDLKPSSPKQILTAEEPVTQAPLFIETKTSMHCSPLIKDLTSPIHTVEVSKLELKLPILGTPKGGIDEASPLVFTRKSQGAPIKVSNRHSESSDSSSSEVKAHKKLIPRPSHPIPKSSNLGLIALRQDFKGAIKSEVKIGKSSIKLTPKSKRKNTGVLNEKAGIEELPERPQTSAGIPANEHESLSEGENVLFTEGNQESKEPAKPKMPSLKQEKGEFKQEKGEMSSSSSDFVSKVSSSSESSESESSSNSSEDSLGFKVPARKKKIKSVLSVNSSDVSDTENDHEVKYTKAQGDMFLRIIESELGIPSLGSAPHTLDITGMCRCLKENFPKRHFSIQQDAFAVLKRLHEIENKIPLKGKEYWTILLTGKIITLDIDEISGEEMAHALGRAFKYILMRKS